MKLELLDTSTLVIGLGVSGTSAARYLLSKGSKVCGYEDNISHLSEELRQLQQAGLQIIEPNTLPIKMNYDFVVVSPGVPKTHPYYLAALKENVLIFGEAELALRQLSQEYKCLGITGTNGKTTVTFLLEHVLNSCGIKAKALGNSGVPLTALLTGHELLEPGSVIVAELSSFQLETLKSPVLDAAVLLNISEDHLDRYCSFDSYAAAKIHLFSCVKPGGSCYINADCYRTYAHLLGNYTLRSYGYEPSSSLYTNGRAIISAWGQGQDCPLPSELQGRSGIDIENLLAVYGLAEEFNLAPADIMTAMSSFKKPPHRLEFVKEINGVNFIDDSKATNVDAVVRAVESIPSSIILIAGGVDKGGSYAPWGQSFGQKVRAICTIGQAADKIKKEMECFMPIYHFNELEEAVTYAAKLAKPNENVLLSPGCSSYDMFTSYAHRGRLFKEIVQDLAKKEDL